ncbi:hypothetical protein JQC72_04910 [Polycladomyces sp. WAk]|uniref:Uncharacterized protein n=1 Tax=Polycladomyces zharkentensis TaxID=2807616 RepID=A0ABS2WHH3_9BACL|nr:hypothetical protein [Polycladomyces sp. WAk]MBN2908864.1 hypothetical protein [Polycladomyces sp. WAk]
MTQPSLQRAIDADLKAKSEELAEQYGMDLSEFLAYCTYDRVNHGELERMRELLEKFRQTIFDVVNEAETLADLPNKELFIAAVDGAFNAFQFILPGELGKMLQQSVVEYQKRQSEEAVGEKQTTE